MFQKSITTTSQIAGFPGSSRPFIATADAGQCRQIYLHGFVSRISEYLIAAIVVTRFHMYGLAAVAAYNLSMLSVSFRGSNFNVGDQPLTSPHSTPPCT